MLGEVLNWTSDKFPLLPCLTTSRKKSSDFQNLLYCIVRFRTFPLGNITLAICFNDIASVIKNIKLERKPQAITLFWMTNYRKWSPLSHPSTAMTFTLIVKSPSQDPSWIDNVCNCLLFWHYATFKNGKQQSTIQFLTHFQLRPLQAFWRASNRQRKPETFEEFQLLANLKDSSLAIETNLGEGKC